MELNAPQFVLVKDQRNSAITYTEATVTITDVNNLKE